MGQHPDAPQPAVTIASNAYKVAGSFFVDVVVSAAGDITITCD